MTFDRTGGPARLVRVAALFGAVVLALASCASHAARSGARQSTQSTGSPQARAHTVVKTFHAYRPDGTLAVPVAGAATSGRCWTTSIAAQGKGDYRCFAGNQILDPCFAPPHMRAPRQVACLTDPWSSAHLLRLHGGLPQSPAPVGAGRPWALQLANGARCVAATGTVPAVRRINLDYQCSDGHDAALLHSTGAAMTAEYGDVQAQTLRRVAVTTIWRA